MWRVMPTTTGQEIHLFVMTGRWRSGNLLAVCASSVSVFESLGAEFRGEMAALGTNSVRSIDLFRSRVSVGSPRAQASGSRSLLDPPQPERGPISRECIGHFSRMVEVERFERATMFGRVRFADRNDAGRRLAVAVRKIPLERPVVYALPRGGVPVAIQVATALDAPLDLVLVRKIGAPGQPELAVGAIVDGDRPETLVNEDIAASTGADAVYLASVQERERRELERRRAIYLAGRAPVDSVQRDAIVVDDGVATGASMLVAVRALRRRGARRVIVATPVAPPDTVARLEMEADLVVCLTRPDWFPGISAFYDDFHQLEDREVVELLRAGAAPDSTT